MATAKQDQAEESVEVQHLKLSQLVPTNDNRRGRITNESVRSLANSIAADGVLQPIIVRPHPKHRGKYEIRAGERRFKAAKLAGLSSVPAIIRELDDEAALAVTVVENLQRRNLTPLEQAETINLAIKNGYDLKAVAAKLGLSDKQTARRGSLINLSAAWKTALGDEKSVVRGLGFGHLELLARLPHDVQEAIAADDFAAIADYGELPTVAELDKLINGALHRLSAMPWSVEDETIVPEVGACSECKKRSDKHPLLFDDEPAKREGRVSKTATCLDPFCFERKEIAHVLRCEAKERDNHGGLQLVVLGDGFSDGRREAFGDRVRRIYNPKFVAKKTKNTVAVMPVDGPRAGKVLYVMADDESSHVEKVKKAAQKEKKPLTLAERKEKLERRRQSFVVKAVREYLTSLDDTMIDRLAKDIANRNDEAASTFEPAALLLCLGTEQRFDSPAEAGSWLLYDQLVKTKKTTAITKEVLGNAVAVWSGRLRDWGSAHTSNQFEEARRVCELMDWDFAEAVAKAETEIPTPKSWQNLKDDGTPRR